MLTGIIGRKVGMTQLFAQDGTVTAGTVLKAGPCVVVQAKTATTDGYEAVQLGLVEERPARVRKPLEGHYKKAGGPPTPGARGTGGGGPGGRAKAARGALQEGGRAAHTRAARGEAGEGGRSVEGRRA